MGVLRIGISTVSGSQLGVSIFHDQDAGTYVTTLLWLCPFTYLATTMGGILNDPGRTSSTFFWNVTAMVIWPASVFSAISRYGILGYLWGMLISELALALMSFLAVKHLVPFCWDTIDMTARPILLLLVSIGVYLVSSQARVWLKEFPLFTMTTVQILFLSFSYMGLLLLFHKKQPLP